MNAASFRLPRFLAQRRVQALLSKPGQKHWIGEAYYFVYNFDKRPQMGTIIMKIQVFTKDGKQDSRWRSQVMRTCLR